MFATAHGPIVLLETINYYAVFHICRGIVACVIEIRFTFLSLRKSFQIYTVQDVCDIIHTGQGRTVVILRVRLLTARTFARLSGRRDRLSLEDYVCL